MSDTRESIEIIRQSMAAHTVEIDAESDYGEADFEGLEVSWKLREFGSDEVNMEISVTNNTDLPFAGRDLVLHGETAGSNFRHKTFQNNSFLDTTFVVPFGTYRFDLR